MCPNSEEFLQKSTNCRLLGKDFDLILETGNILDYIWISRKIVISLHFQRKFEFISKTTLNLDSQNFP